MKENTIDFQFKGRYFEMGNPDTAKEIWFVLHGHGQLAEYFIKKFEKLNPNDFYIIAPEGLSKYYLQGYTGRVGATWMTRENRLIDIDNYITYLDIIYSNVINKVSKEVKITALGFSQGTATVSRWISSSQVTIHRLILWAGNFPPDMHVAATQIRIKDVEILNVYGTKDQFLNQEKLKEQHLIIDSIGATPTQLTFDGAHEIDENTLMKIATNSY